MFAISVNVSQAEVTWLFLWLTTMILQVAMTEEILSVVINTLPTMDVICHIWYTDGVAQDNSVSPYSLICMFPSM